MGTWTWLRSKRFAWTAFTVYLIGILSSNFYPYISTRPTGPFIDNGAVGHAFIENLSPLIGGVGVIVLMSALVGRLWMVVLVLLPFWIALPFQWFHVLEFAQPISATTLAIVFQTNMEEASSYLSGRTIYFSVAVGLLCVFGAIVLEATRRADIRWRHGVRWWAASALTLLALLCAPFRGVALPTTALPPTADFSDRATAQLLRIASGMQKAYPLNLGFSISDYIERAALASSELEYFKKNKLSLPVIAKSRTSGKKEIYVLVIGESSRYDRWGIHDYHRDTTPRLALQKNLISFPDAVSLTSYTDTSVPIILTAEPLSTNKTAGMRPTIMSIFREAGFRTYWLSTQPPSGFGGATFMGALAHQADQVEFLNPVSSFTVLGQFDNSLLAPLSRILNAGEMRQFIVLHTLGSHFHYHRRYPAEYKRWSPTYEIGENPYLVSTGETHIQKFNNAYDNSILYTDYVLSQIIERIRETDAAAILLYSSDHGETIYDGSCKTAGHESLSRLNFHIPLLIWYSDKFIASAPSFISVLYKNRKQPITTDSLYHTFLTLARIETPYLRLQKSLASEQYMPTTRLVKTYDGRIVDFDSELKRIDCSIASK